MVKILTFFALFLAAGFFWNESVGAEAENLIRVKEDKKGWFAYGDQIGVITPHSENAHDKCTVAFGKISVVLDHRVNKVVTNASHCVFAGEKRLSVVQFKPEIKLEYSRDFPVDTPATVRLIGKQVVGSSAGAHTVWVWSIPGDTEWTLRQPPVVPLWAVPMRERIGFLTENNLLSSSQDGFNSLVRLEGNASPNGVYGYEDRIIIFSQGGIGVYEAKESEKGPVVKRIEWYAPIFLSLDNPFPLRLDEMSIYIVNSDGAFWVYEMDIKNERYRKIKINKVIYGEHYLFIRGRDIWSSMDISKGPVISAGEFDRQSWEKLEKQAFKK